MYYFVDILNSTIYVNFEKYIRISNIIFADLWKMIIRKNVQELIRPYRKN